MARAGYQNKVINASGDAVASASIRVLDEGTANLISETMYDAPSGGNTQSNPITADGDGDFVIWLDVPKRVDIEVSGTGIGTKTYTVDVVPKASSVPQLDVQSTFTARQAFNHNDTLLGAGVNDPDGVYVDIGSLGETHVWLDARSTNLANIDIKLRPKGTGSLRIENDNSTLIFGTGGDTNLYRSAADTLKTDDSFIVGGGLKVDDTAAEVRSGTGTPEGAVTAPIGSIYLRTNGGAATTLYVKESGAGNTGWVAK